MIEKKVRMRSQQKHDIEANWNRATAFIPMAGELVVYDIDENYSYSRLKIGDGQTSVVDLPFHGSIVGLPEEYVTKDFVNKAIDEIELLPGPKGDKGDKGAAGKDGLTTAVKVGNAVYEHQNGLIELPEFLTEHQSLEGYYTKEETKALIPNVSDFTDAVNVTTKINNKAISEIFEENGTTVKRAAADSAGNIINETYAVKNDLMTSEFVTLYEGKLGVLFYSYEYLTQGYQFTARKSYTKNPIDQLFYNTYVTGTKDSNGNGKLTCVLAAAAVKEGDTVTLMNSDGMQFKGIITAANGEMREYHIFVSFMQ